MSQKYDFEIRLTRREYLALMDIRGLEPEAHAMVMCASLQKHGDWILQGSHDAFDALLRDLDMEIEEQVAPKKNIPALQRIRESITPDDDEAAYTTQP